MTLTPLRRLAPIAALVALGLLVPQTASAGLILRIDSGTKTFFFEGDDSGNGDYDQFNPHVPGDYSLQFIHYFSTPVSASTVLTPNPQNFFVEGTGLYGNMNLISNYGQYYVFMDLTSGSNDITTLTGKGPTVTASYAGLAAADIPLFESLIGQTLVQSIGTGYGPISVQSVQSIPEVNPVGIGSAFALFTGALGLLGRRRLKPQLA